jgi:hypothetical protein
MNGHGNLKLLILFAKTLTKTSGKMLRAILKPQNR